MGNVTPGNTKAIKIGLAASLAINLLIVGAVGGAYLSGGSRDDRVIGQGHTEGGAGAFGVFSKAMSPDDRRAVRQALRARQDEFRAGRRAARQEVATVIRSLQEKPFDAASLTSAFEAQKKRASDRVSLGQKVLIERIIAMTDAERQAYAGRLEEVVDRRLWRP